MRNWVSLYIFNCQPVDERKRLHLLWHSIFVSNVAYWWEVFMAHGASSTTDFRLGIFSYFHFYSSQMFCTLVLTSSGPLGVLLFMFQILLCSNTPDSNEWITIRFSTSLFMTNSLKSDVLEQKKAVRRGPRGEMGNTAICNSRYLCCSVYIILCTWISSYSMFGVISGTDIGTVYICDQLRSIP